MAEVKDKLVTVESVAALHEYNKQRVIDVAHGGTGATTAKAARENLNAAAKNKIIRTVNELEAHVESNVTEMLNGLVPHVNIIAQDKGNNSEGAMIQVADYTNEELDDTSHIKLKAAEVEVLSDMSSFSGDVKIGGELKLEGKIAIDGHIECNDMFNLKNKPICVSSDALTSLYTGTDGRERFNAFGLNTETNDLEIGFDGHKFGVYDTYLRGNNVGIYSNGQLNMSCNKLNITCSNTGENPRAYGENVELWSGCRWMGVNKNDEAVSINFTGGKVSEQPNGIVLVFSRYEYEDATKDINYNKFVDDNFHSFFIPKAQISQHNGHGTTFLLYYKSIIYNKYLHIWNDHIVGNKINQNISNEVAGENANNRMFVLRAVYGV